MVAYSFKKQFVPLIESGRKRQTIRALRHGRSRHARPGEMLQIYFAMRTKHCRKIIEDPECRNVEPITIEVSEPPYGISISVDDELLDDHDSRFLAVQDGFDTLGDMWCFWLNNHGAGTFKGVIIKW